MNALTALALAAACCAALPAHADVYTWVDAKGNVNVGNLEPPQGARVLSVSRENPDARARAQAAREAAQQAEMKALAERVAELEKTSRPPDAPPPVVYQPMPVAAPPPPPQVNVVVVPSPPPQQVAPVADYGCAWVGCAVPFVYPFVFFGSPRHGRHDHGMHRFDPPHERRMPVTSHAFAPARRGWGRS